LSSAHTVPAGSDTTTRSLPLPTRPGPPLPRVQIERPLGPSIAIVSRLKLEAYTVVPSSTGVPSTSAMRSSSLRPSPVETSCSHSRRPSGVASAATEPSSLPTNT
jgi:hypothetical protein